IVLDPSGLGKVLRELLVGATDDTAAPVQHQHRAARGTLIDGDDDARGSAPHANNPGRRRTASLSRPWSRSRARAWNSCMARASAPADGTARGSPMCTVHLVGRGNGTGGIGNGGRPSQP